MAASAGLRGIVAGQTALSTVGVSGSGLTYCGFDIKALAIHCDFEEVLYLLWHQALPSRTQLQRLQNSMIEYRVWPASLLRMIECIPKEAHPMDVLRTICSAVGHFFSESDQGSEAFQAKHAERLLVLLTGGLLYWYHYSHFGKKIELTSSAVSLAEYFLDRLHLQPPSAQYTSALQTSLVLYAEHEFNASTFTARVVASTLSDVYSGITAAIGALRGPLHGGANEAAMAMLQELMNESNGTDQGLQAVEASLLAKLANKEKIMGFGHAIYRESDPRSDIIKEVAKGLLETDEQHRLFAISERVEEVMWREKKLFPNADFYHASAYHAMSIPTKLFTPIFVLSRLSGWVAHMMEQWADNRIIRPSADYVGPERRAFVPIKDR